MDHPNKLKSDSDENLEKKPSSLTEEELDFSPGKVDGSSIGFEELTLDVLMVCFFFWIPMFEFFFGDIEFYSFPG